MGEFVKAGKSTLTNSPIRKGGLGSGWGRVWAVLVVAFWCWVAVFFYISGGMMASIRCGPGSDSAA